MKKVHLAIVALVIAASLSAVSCDFKKGANLSNAVDSASYAIGVANGTMFGQQLESFPGGPVNKDVLIAGFVAGLKGDSASVKMTVEEAQEYLNTYFVETQARIGREQMEKGTKFLEENKGKSGVITTESGLQYKVVTEGTGERPAASDRVKVHYTGKTLDGKVFDSSVERGEPTQFGVDQVIKGWTEGLQIMPVGSKYILWIPSELAYGERGAGQDILPNSVLEFEVELIEIIKED